MKYLLSNGSTTINPEVYILDLFRLYLQINPGDIPGDRGIGFNFTLTNVIKDQLRDEITNRVSDFVEKIRSKFDEARYNITVDTIELVNEETINLVLSVNGTKDTIKINIA